VPAPEKREDLFPQMDNCRLTLEAARIRIKPEGACEEPVDLPNFTSPNRGDYTRFIICTGECEVKVRRIDS
jgi:hypothetical protein